MDSSFINIAIVVVYLLAMLAFGWWGKSRTKNNSDFLVAGRRLGPFLYTGTMAAVVLGGGSQFKVGRGELRTLLLERAIVLEQTYGLLKPRPSVADAVRPSVFAGTPSLQRKLGMSELKKRESGALLAARRALTQSSLQ